MDFECHRACLRAETFSFCTLYFQILAAYVKSIEDHGYILHFGLPSFTGFLPKNISNNGKHHSTVVNYS